MKADKKWKRKISNDLDAPIYVQNLLRSKIVRLEGTFMTVVTINLKIR